MKITAYITGIIPVVAAAMRFASRWIGGNPFWWDDWLHLISAVSMQNKSLSSPLTILKALCVPLCAVFIKNMDEGLGKHLWDLTYPRVFAIGRWSMLSDTHSLKFC